MAIRLSTSRANLWVEIGNGAALFCRPPTTLLYHAAIVEAGETLAQLVELGIAATRAGGQVTGIPDLLDERNSRAVREALFTLSFAELAATDWRGILDADGEALSFDSALLAPLFEDHSVAASFRDAYLRPLHEVVAEGKG